MALVSWETAQDIAAVKAPGGPKNATPPLTQKQAIALLEAIPSDTLQGIRDLALMSVSKRGEAPSRPDALPSSRHLSI